MRNNPVSGNCLGDLVFFRNGCGYMLYCRYKCILYVFFKVVGSINQPMSVSIFFLFLQN